MMESNACSAWREPISRLARAAPFFVAHPLDVFLEDEIKGSRAPRLALFSLCESVEALVRFLSVARSGEIIGESETGKAPLWLAKTAAHNLPAPTFGKWMDFLREIAAREKQKPSRLLPQLAAAVAAFDTQFFPQTAGAKRPEQSNLLSVRNPIAHGSGISDAYARELLAIWAPRIAAVLETLHWLGDIELWARDTAGLWRMNGPNVEGICCF